MTKKRMHPAHSEEPVGAATNEAQAKAAPIPEELSLPMLKERIAVVEGEKAEIYDRMLRIAADFDNWKKRARKDQTDGELRTKESVLCNFLEIVDSLERATALWADGKETDAKSVRDGVELVLRQFLSKLQHYDVKPMAAAGVPFDPRMHEAVSQVPSADVTPGAVLHELQKGYLIGDKLLRPAMVVVAAAPSTT
jgi:molecular chaperone GrpE